MIASFLSGQKETVVIVRLNRTLQVCTFFKVKHGTEPSSRSQCTDNPPVLSITNSGFRPGGSVRALEQMQQNYSGPRSLKFFAICVYKCVRRRLRNTAEPDANFQEWKKKKCEKVAQLSIVALMVSSLRTEAFWVLFSFFASSCSAETLKHTNGRHLYDIQWNILWWLHKGLLL